MAQRQLHEAVDRRDHQPVRHAGQPAGASRWWRSCCSDATPFEVALLGTIEFLPFILFSLPAGAWVDRLRRRPILIAGRPGSGAQPRLDPDRPRAGRAVRAAAVRRRVRQRRPDRAVRRRLPVLPAEPGGAGPDPGGQRQAGGQPHPRPERRARRIGRRAHRPRDGARRDRRGRHQLPRSRRCS